MGTRKAFLAAKKSSHWGANPNRLVQARLVATVDFVDRRSWLVWSAPRPCHTGRCR
jgi:hypothetical protein